MRSIVVLIPVGASLLMAQESLGPSPVLLNGDMAVLESGDARTDLNCTVTPVKPALGFDLKFHAGYVLDIPLRELRGQGNVLSILFRVTPKAGGPASYFNQQFRVPPLDEDKGGANLQGWFDTGEGSYHVDWFVHDFAGRMCASNWDVTAAADWKGKDVAMVLPPNSVRASEDEKFQAEPPVARSQNGAPLNVKVLMNFAPDRADSPTLDPSDRVALISILRNISRSPQIGKFSLVAFNIQEQRVLYKQESANQIDFPQLGRAVKTLTLGTVGVTQLESKHPDTDFLSELVRNETSTTNVDGLIFVGPKAMLEANVPDQDVKQIGDLDYPVFYMNYNPNPTEVPWKDSISRLVKFFKGREYTISGPKDLWNAVTEVVTRIAKSKESRGTGISGGGSR